MNAPTTANLVALRSATIWLILSSRLNWVLTGRAPGLWFSRLAVHVIENLRILRRRQRSRVMRDSTEGRKEAQEDEGVAPVYLVAFRW